MTTKAVADYVAVLQAEIQHLKSTLQPHDTGHIHTTISTLTHRIKEIENENNYDETTRKK
jgi:methylaspartate ammonia-lyase